MKIRNEILVKRFEKFEKDFHEKQKTMFDDFKRQIDTLRVEISASVLREVGRDFAAKTDNGTDVMKSVYSVIHSIGDGLKRTNAKQRAEGGTIAK